MKILKYFTLIGFVFIAFISCKKNSSEIYLGGDFSYINEMLDCGAVYRENGAIVDPYELFGKKGANISRIRLWHSPDWTAYSTYKDVEKAIRKSKAAGMRILLDFHYSDNWADPGDQIIPKAWADIEDLEVLGDSLYNYTFTTISKLSKAGLTPEFVQVGNETNSEILLEEHVDELTEPINWTRNIFLLNKGIQAVNDVSKEIGFDIQTMIHIAQPEFSFPWFDSAFQYKIEDFDWIGLSYYPNCSTYKMTEVASAIDSLITSFEKPVMVVETAYPYTLEGFDEANNILGEDALIPGYPATPEGQLNFMIALTKEVLKGGGVGVIYWEPAWVSSSCSTRWGKGSHWENATFFDGKNGNEVLPVFNFFNNNYFKD